MKDLRSKSSSITLKGSSLTAASKIIQPEKVDTRSKKQEQSKEVKKK
jgi:hypothetical protein